MIKIEGRSLKIPTQERIIGWVGDNRVEVRILGQATNKLHEKRWAYEAEKIFV